MKNNLDEVQRLSQAIRIFNNLLPGWWWSVGSCSVSRDASCGPDKTGPDAHLLEIRLFDDGFHCDDREGDCADALLHVMNKALYAKKGLE